MAAALMQFINWSATIRPHLKEFHATLVVTQATIPVTEAMYQDTNIWDCFVW